MKNQKPFFAVFPYLQSVFYEKSKIVFCCFSLFTKLFLKTNVYIDKFAIYISTGFNLESYLKTKFDLKNEARQTSIFKGSISGKIKIF